MFNNVELFHQTHHLVEFIALLFLFLLLFYFPHPPHVTTLKLSNKKAINILCIFHPTLKLTFTQIYYPLLDLIALLLLSPLQGRLHTKLNLILPLYYSLLSKVVFTQSSNWLDLINVPYSFLLIFYTNYSSGESSFQI